MPFIFLEVFQNSHALSLTVNPFRSWFTSISTTFCCFTLLVFFGILAHCRKISRCHQDVILVSVRFWAKWASWSFPWMCTRACTFQGFWQSLNARLNNYYYFSTWPGTGNFETRSLWLILLDPFAPAACRRNGTSCMDVPHTHGHSASHLYAACESIKQRRVQICTNSCRRGGSQTKLH